MYAFLSFFFFLYMSVIALLRLYVQCIMRNDGVITSVYNTGGYLYSINIIYKLHFLNLFCSSSWYGYTFCVSKNKKIKKNDKLIDRLRLYLCKLLTNIACFSFLLFLHFHFFFNNIQFKRFLIYDKDEGLCMV